MLNNELGVSKLTLGVLHGETGGNDPPRRMDRNQVLVDRNQVLGDGSMPMGIRFTSKHGGEDCWATG
jgi:hypothetical protein